MDLKNIKMPDFKDPATICVLAGSVLMLLASFLPIETAKALGVTESRNLMGDYHRQGIFLLILAIATVVILILGLDREKFLSGALGASAAVGLWAMINAITGLNATKKDFEELEAFGMKVGSTSFSIGFYVLILGIIAVGAAIFFVSKGTKKGSPAQPQAPQAPQA